MILWLKANAGTIIVSFILIAVVAIVIFKMIRNRKNGKSACGCGCENCSNKKLCHK